MGGDKNSFTTLLNFLNETIITFPDIRKGENKKYEIRDAVISAFATFFMQCPSFLSQQNLMQKNKGNNNARTIFGVYNIPSDNQIRNLLDPINPELLIPAFNNAYSFLKEKNIIDSYVSFNDNLLIPLDGTWFFSSNNISCNKCLHINHKDGTVTHYHSAITPVIVKPGNNKVISLPPEFITPQDGKTKQDCENQAAKRWLKGEGLKYLKDYKVTILGDDLYSRQPVCEVALSFNYNFIFVCKSSSHKYLYEWLAAFDNPKEDLNEKIIKHWTGKERLYYRYRFINNVPLKDGEDALQVNWAELVVFDKQGNVKKRFSYITNHIITEHNIVSLIEAGRAKWKIENENNNTLKTKGYHLEHNFGHGEKHLSNFLLSLNLLSFLFHTILECFDQRYVLLRKTLPRRKDFFHHIKCLTYYICFSSWTDMLIFMIKGLELEDPG